MLTVAEHVPFKDLCTLCERVAQNKHKDKKKPLLDFITRWRDFHTKLHAGNSDETDSFFPVLRLLLPQCEKERPAYGIKEVMLAKLYVEILCLSKDSADAQKLLNYRSPKNAKGEAGDFASVAYFILNKRCPEKGTLKIYDVNQRLDNIATNNSLGNKAEVKSNLLFLLRNTSALEQKWLIRMILKDMKMGTSEQTVLNAFHPDARDLYNVTNSLLKVCLKLRDPTVRLHEIEVSLFSPFRPMLAEQAHPQEVEKLMKNEPFVIEVKFDGERVQIHKEGNKFKYFSRGGHDCTNTYGGSPLEGNLTPYIAKSFKSSVRNCILDGEVVIYSNTLNCIVSKGENADVRAMQPDGDYGSCFCAFDILMLNGKILSNLPLKERADCLKEIFTPIENKIRLTEQKQGLVREDVDVALNDAISQREEGIVIKNPLSVYRPNIRRGGGWLKIKPEYIDNLMDELDLLIIGGYFGEGRRANMISHFILGVAVPSLDSGQEHPKKFCSVTKIGSGYSLKELSELLRTLAPHWNVFNPRNLPKNIDFGRKEKPDVWIEPSKSKIVQVKASEIVRSDRFPLNCTLRFPRVEKIRYDKAWHQCMTTEDLENLRRQAEGRLATHNYQVISEDSEPSPKKRQVVRNERVIAVAPQFRPADVSDVQQESEILSGKEICVIVASLQKKQEVEKLIVRCGGHFVQNPGPETFCVMVDKLTLKAKNIINTKLYDVVKVDWLYACVQKQQLIPWVPDDMLQSTKTTLSKFSEFFDEYGDSYFTDTTEESLRSVFKNIPKEKWEVQSLPTAKIADIEYKYFSNLPSFGLFRTCRVYMNDKSHIGDSGTLVKNHPLSWTAMKLQLYGASLTDELDDQVTHVIVHSSEEYHDHVVKLRELSRARKTGNFHIVTDVWVEQCVGNGKLLGERNYQPS